METDLNEPINEVEEELGGTTDTSPTKKCCNKVCCCGSMYVLFQTQTILALCAGGVLIAGVYVIIFGELLTWTLVLPLATGLPLALAGVTIGVYFSYKHNKTVKESSQGVEIQESSQDVEIEENS